MINNSTDLLRYINANGGTIYLSENTSSETCTCQDMLESFLAELSSLGYIKRYVRSYGITPSGRDFLNR